MSGRQLYCNTKEKLNLCPVSGIVEHHRQVTLGTGGRETFVLPPKKERRGQWRNQSSNIASGGEVANGIGKSCKRPVRTDCFSLPVLLGLAESRGSPR